MITRKEIISTLDEMIFIAGYSMDLLSGKDAMDAEQAIAEAKAVLKQLKDEEDGSS